MDDVDAVLDRIGRPVPHFERLLRAAAEAAAEVRLVPSIDGRTGNVVFVAEVEARLEAGPEAGCYVAVGQFVHPTDPDRFRISDAG